MSTPNARPPLPRFEDFDNVREDRLRVTDIDFQKHVNNAIYGQFFGSARFDFLNEEVRPLLEEGAKLVVASTSISYLAEMVYDASRIRTMSRIKSLGRSSMQFEQIIVQNSKICTHAITTMVHRGPEGSTPWPEAIVQKFPRIMP